RHLGKVPLDLRDVVVFVALRIRLERAVGHAADGKRLVAEEEELAAHARAGSPGGHAVHPGRGQCARGGGGDAATAAAARAARRRRRRGDASLLERVSGAALLGLTSEPL